DACPDQPGVPDPDPAKNGCPTKLVEIRGDQIIIKEQIFFSFDRDNIKPQSFPLMQEVANTILRSPQIKKVRIEGHTDHIGGPESTLALSNRRARSVQRWLVEHKVEAGRLESIGYGKTRPLAPGSAKADMAKNRRVEFYIVDP